MMEVTECPQCGAPASPSERKCGYCKAQFFVTNLAYLESLDSESVGKYLKHYKELTRKDPDSAEGLLGLGLCYLQMGTYPLARKSFERVIEIAPEVASAYYYHSLSTIAGRRLMTLPLKEIRSIESFLETSIQVDGDLPQCKLLLAMLKRDYYETNGMRVNPPSVDALLSDIGNRNIDELEISRLRDSVRIGDESIFGALRKN
jgi:tetratricopeptide (TPR) repeat protein